MTATYQRIVFMQGDDAEEPLRILDEQGQDAAVEYLAQWDIDGDDVHDTFSEPGSGTNDDVYSSADGYRLTYNAKLGYIGLERVIAD